MTWHEQFDINDMLIFIKNYLDSIDSIENENGGLLVGEVMIVI